MQKLLFIFSLCLTFIFPQKLFAQTAFTTDMELLYLIDQSGIGEVKQTINIKNNTPSLFVTQYEISIASTQIKNLSVTDNKGKNIPFSSKIVNDTTVISLNFDDQIVGKDKIRTFIIHYRHLDSVEKNGQVIEVSIPRLTDPSSIDKYAVTLLVPLEFGTPAQLSPDPDTIDLDPIYRKITFTHSDIKNSGITGLFGEKRSYDFKLTYNLTNPTITPVITQIVLPADTAYQSVFYDQIDPPPSNIDLDGDGNWIATYELASKEIKTITALGKFLVYPKPVSLDYPQNPALENHLQANEIWPVNDNAVSAFLGTANTIPTIYQKVVDTLAYNYDRLHSATPSRLKVLDTLKSPQDALCLEYADLLVTAFRNQNIPARLVLGYAYTDNERLKPASLNNTLLHAWVEYYDVNDKIWHSVDPTWEDTTGGLDYLTGWDANHIAFVKQGINPDKPPSVGFYGDNPETKAVQIMISDTIPLNRYLFVPQPNTLNHLPWFNLIWGKFSFKNDSNRAMYNIDGLFDWGGITIPYPKNGTHLFPHLTYTVPISFYQSTNSKQIHGQLIFPQITLQFTQTLKPPVPIFTLVLCLAVTLVLYAAYSRRTRSLLVRRK